MSHWREITKALYKAGGGPLPRDSFALLKNGQDPAHILQECKKHGLMVASKQKYQWVWTLTPKGTAFCEGRIIIKRIKTDRPPRYLFAPTWCGGIAEVRISK